MTVVLAALMVVALGTWIPLAQLIPGTSERHRLVLVAAGNLVFAGIALLVSGTALHVDGRRFWLPLAGGVVWTAGNYCVFRASAMLGLARAAGTWTPLNIIAAFVWGAALFGELDTFSVIKFAILGIAFLAIVAGVLLIAGARETSPSARAPSQVNGRSTAARTGFLWAAGAGLLWGSYFVPAQWAGVPAQVSNFPLAVGIFAAAAVLAATDDQRFRLDMRGAATQLGAGVVFGVGNLLLLALVSRVGTGTGFTIAQLSLAVNAVIGIWVLRSPEPGTRQARKVLLGIAIAGIGGTVIAALQ